FAHINWAVIRQRPAVALLADAVLAFASKRRAHFDEFLLLDRALDLSGQFAIDGFSCLADDFAGFLIDVIFGKRSSKDSLGDLDHDLVAFGDGLHMDTTL